VNAAAALRADEDQLQRETHAVLFKAMADFLVARNLASEVRRRVPERVRRAIDRPPLPQSWMPSSSTEEIVRAVYELGGAPLALQLGKFVARQLCEGRLRPLIEQIFATLGKSPAALFRMLNLSSSLAVRGITFRYEGDYVVAWYRGGHVPVGSFHALRGHLLQAFELTGTHGEVGEPELVAEDGEGVQVRYRVLF
jgi:hypothetical protein